MVPVSLQYEVINLKAQFHLESITPVNVRNDRNKDDSI